MAEMKWCKRERILINSLGAVAKFVGIIIGMASVAFTLWFLAATIAGEQFGFDMNFFGGLVSAFTVMLTPMIVAMMAMPTEEIKWAMPLYGLSALLGALASLAAFNLGTPIGAIGVSIFALYAVWMFVHISCMQEYHAKLLEQLSREPTYKEAWDYIKKARAV